MLCPTRNRLLPVLLIFLVTLFSCSQESDSADHQTEAVKDTAVSAPVDSLVITLAGADSSSVLELLQASHTVEVHRSALGSFVQGVDSIRNEQGYFWLYSVNDSAGKVAADKCLTSEGDVVKWHYRKIGE